MIKVQIVEKSNNGVRGVVTDEKIQLFKSNSADCCGINRPGAGHECVHAVWTVSRGVQQYSHAGHDYCGFDYV